MNILGLNAYHGDSAACIVVDGHLIAAAEEERFRRVKHWAGFPSEAIRWCLAESRFSLSEIDVIAVNRDPRANAGHKLAFMISRRPSPGAVAERLKNKSRIEDLPTAFREAFGEAPKAGVVNVEHHRAHLASAFFVSPFKDAAVVSVDGFGDFVSTMWAVGREAKIDVKGEVRFPHSLGLFYLAMTQYLGFPKYGDEYKMMGLAPYGKPSRLDAMRTIVRLKPDGAFELDLKHFLHQAEGVSMVWENGEPTIGRAFSPALEELLGPARAPDAPLEDRHKDAAASAQAMYEEAFFHVLKHAHKLAGSDNLALAGGCAMNSVANGKVYANTPFKKLYVQAASGDAGGAIGAAFHVWNAVKSKPRTFVMRHAYWGPVFSDDDVSAVLHAHDADIRREACRVEHIASRTGLCFKAARAIADGKVVGWFQGRMEWGPRALGNRSILCDPRRADMKDILNLKIKRRESFRPFAPSILREAVPAWFETDDDVPFMMQVYQIREEKRHVIPAVTHVNGSGRLQTVAQSENPVYHELILRFSEMTGVPLVLNTSFNENEPIVCRPEEALDCFLRTKMDVLVLGNFFVERAAS